MLCTSYRSAINYHFVHVLLVRSISHNNELNLFGCTTSVIYSVTFLPRKILNPRINLFSDLLYHCLCLFHGCHLGGHNCVRIYSLVDGVNNKINCLNSSNDRYTQN